MANWLDRAKREIPQSAGRATAIADERNPTAVTAVSEPGEPEISRASIGSNGSAPVEVFREIQAVNEATVPMTPGEESAIRAWLTHIEETDPVMIAEVLDRCCADADARAYFMRRAKEAPAIFLREQSVTCGNCHHFTRIDHPHLGHCAKGEPEAVAGLWDTDRRRCKRYVRRSDTVPLED